ncbi:MAG: alpha/beta hydrolase [Terracidiphilus sp.]
MLRNLVSLVIFACLSTGLGLAQSVPPSVPKDSVEQKNPSSPRPPIAGKENWAQLPVDRKALPLYLAGVSLGKTETPDFTRELIRLQWRASDPVDIWVVMPHGVTKPRVALYLYSYPSDIDRFRDNAWCQAATQHGLAAVGFISALTGERFRLRPMRDWFVPELQESMGSTVHDVQLIIDYLQKRGDLSVDKVGMFGQGSGGSIAILAAAADPRITAVDLLNPWGDWPDWLKGSPLLEDSERSKYLTADFLQKAAAVEPISFLPQLKDRAIRIQQILDYPNNPPAARDKIAETVPAIELVQFKDRPAHAESWKTAGMSGWLAQQLQSKSEKQTESAGK